MAKIKNIVELRNKTLEIIDKLEDGSIELIDAKEINNAVGKSLKSLTTELEYAKMKKVEPKIDFLDG